LAIYSTPTLADCEANGQPDNTANRSHDGDVLRLTAGDWPAATSSLIAAYLNAQRPQFELGRFWARYVTSETANDQPDQQKRNQVRAPLHRS
jgi:hypothetical protein